MRETEKRYVFIPYCQNFPTPFLFRDSFWTYGKYDIQFIPALSAFTYRNSNPPPELLRGRYGRIGIKTICFSVLIFDAPRSSVKKKSLKIEIC
jgi:hypothetical protein